MATQMRIQALPGRDDDITCAIVFSPVETTPGTALVLIQRPDAKEGMLGPRGWAVASDGLRPRLVERRGGELWLMFGSQLSWHLQRGTPVAVTEMSSGLSGKAIWPAIPRGRPPTVMPSLDDGDRQEMSGQDGTGQDRTVVQPPPPPPPPPPRPPIERPPAPGPGPGVTGPVVPPVGGGDRPPPGPASPPRRGWLLLLVPLLLLAGAAAWWLQGRGDSPTVEEAAPQPSPAPPPQAATPAPQPVPAQPDPAQADACLDVATILTPDCPRSRLATLAPEVQLRLAEGLLQRGGRPSLGLALELLITAASNGHGPAQMALARLYDPASFVPGGAVPNANPARALDLYRDAAGNAVAEAGPARDALAQRLRSEAQGEGATADRARTILRQAGLE
ncbi:hypothetical protein ACVFYP_13265 [Roseomonas sp. F4]